MGTRGKKLFSLLSLSLAVNLWADSEQLYAKYKPAIVKIIEFQQGIEVSSGTGFFVTGRGHFVTNSHVVKRITQAGFHYKVILASGQEFRDIKVNKCVTDATDVCLLQIDYKPTVFFKISQTPDFKVGQEIQTIGHPRGYDFSYAKGYLSGIRTFSPNKFVLKEGGIEQIQFTVPISSGNSGGPIFNNQGELLGVATWVTLDNAQNINFGTSTREIWKNFQRIPPALALPDWKQKLSAETIAKFAKMKKEYIEPVYNEIGAIESGKVANASWDKLFNDDWTTMKSRTVTITKTQETFQYQFKTLRLWDPESCKEEDRSGILGITCWTPDRQNAIEIVVVADEKGAEKLGMRLEGLREFDKKPLPIVETLQQQGRWKQVAAGLSEKQITFLHSKSDLPLKCRGAAGPSGLVWRTGSEHCTGGMIYNFSCPNCSHFYDYVKFPGRPYLVRIGLTMGDPDSADLFAHLKAIANLTLREVKATPAPRTVAGDKK